MAGAARAQEQLASPVEALAEDAGAYAARFGVPLDEAMRRLRAQEETVAATSAIESRFADRIAGISIVHTPEYRIEVLLTGDLTVAPEQVQTSGHLVPVVFRTGAPASRAQVLAALVEHRAAIRRFLPAAQGMGHDPRTGALLVTARGAFTAEALAEREQALTELAGVPVRIRPLVAVTRDAGVEGGRRLEGPDPATRRRFVCTTGFTVTDGTRTGVVTAAHCPDTITYREAPEPDTPLEFVGQWGARYQDVQIHAAPAAAAPVFRAGEGARALREVTTWRNRAATRAGDAVCHRGETTGYSCSLVELVDFAPAGDLCGGPCDPTWVAVEGPRCRSGDSGGPVFSGTVAFGILKGASYAPDGSCAFYYYMSTDYLPEGWRLQHR